MAHCSLQSDCFIDPTYLGEGIINTVEERRERLLDLGSRGSGHNTLFCDNHIIGQV